MLISKIWKPYLLIILLIGTSSLIFEFRFNNYFPNTDNTDKNHIITISNNFLYWGLSFLLFSAHHIKIWVSNKYFILENIFSISTDSSLKSSDIHVLPLKDLGFFALSQDISDQFNNRLACFGNNHIFTV